MANVLGSVTEEAAKTATTATSGATSTTDVAAKQKDTQEAQATKEQTKDQSKLAFNIMWLLMKLVFDLDDNKSKPDNKSMQDKQNMKALVANERVQDLVNTALKAPFVKDLANKALENPQINKFVTDAFKNNPKAEGFKTELTEQGIKFDKAKPAADMKPIPASENANSLLNTGKLNIASAQQATQTATQTAEAVKDLGNIAKMIPK
ncbi:MAG: hypothetical protein WC627_10680 [Legionella sp.]|jgi:hypothetical protein